MHPVLRAHADRHLGLFTTADARHAGYAPEEIRSQCRTGHWSRVRRGVLITAAELAEHERRRRRHRVDCLAALLSLGRPSAVVSHGSAARLWGLPVREDLDRTVRLTDPGEWRRGPGFVVSNAPLRRGEITVAGPLRLTSAARTLVDCAREWPMEAAVVAMDAALLAERTSPGELSAAAARAQRWPGAARARRAASFADGRAESVLESRGRLRILGAGFPAPALQVEISTSARLVGVVDAWFDDVAVAVEFDGQVKYTDPWRDRTPAQVLWEEKRREDELRALGVRLLRITDADLDRWPVLDDRLRRLLAEPGPAERRFTARPRTRGMRRTG